MIQDVTPPARRPKQTRARPIGKVAMKAEEHKPAHAEPEFRTPEQVAALDTFTEPVVTHRGTRTSKWRWWPYTRLQRILCAVLVVLLAFGVGAAWTLTHHKRTVVAETHTKKAAPKPPAPPPVIYSTLTGLPVADASVNQRTVTGVMVENSLDARPQSGLGDAGVVFEAVAEGGVTRFLALYQDTAPSNVGPIRSARPYYVQWAMGFDAAYAHVGGSPDALADIKAWGVQDMNQFYNSSYYHRVTTRAAPHNVYTAVSTLNQLEANKGYASTFTGFVRGKEAPAATPTASGIDFSLSGPIYNPHYDYIAATNSYNRSEGGAIHTDANTGKQLNPKVVIAIVVPLSRGALDSSGAYYSNYNVIGSGQAYVFQNGTVTVGAWQKAGNTAPLTFTDSAGAPLPLNPGQTWITAVSGANQVKYK